MTQTLSPKLVGSRLRPFETSFTAREVSTYAAVVAPHHRVHFDDEADANPPAPPLFATALAWRLVARLRELLEVPIADETLDRMVHFAEHLTLSRLVRSGETLCASGEIVALLPHAMGTRLVIELDVLDAASTRVHLEQIEVLFLGVEGPKDPLVHKPHAPLKLPRGEPFQEPLPALEIPRALPFLYDAASGISAPIHISPRFAKSVGLPDIILHGTCTAALAVTALVDRFADGDPRRVRAFGCKFRGLVLPPTSLSLEIASLHRTNNATSILFHVNSADGSSALRDASLVLG